MSMERKCAISSVGFMCLILAVGFSNSNDHSVTISPTCCSIFHPSMTSLLNGSDTGMTSSICSTKAWTAAVSDVIQYLGWQNVVLLLDNSLCGLDKQRLIASLSERLIGSVPILLDSSSSPSIKDVDKVMGDGLKVMWLQSIRTVVVCVSAETLSAVVKELEEKQQRFAGARWLVVCSGTDKLRLQAFQYLGIQLAFIVPVINKTNTLPEQPPRKGTVEMSTVANTSSAPQPTQANAPRLDQFKVEGYNVGTGTLYVRATWTSSKLDVYSDEIFDSGLSRFGHSPMRVGVAEAEPFLRRLEPKEDGKPNYEGMCMDMLAEMSFRLKFKYELYEPPDGNYGSPEVNGTWNGMVGMLMSGDLDLAIGPFSITSLREEVVDFTVPFMQDGGGILTKGGEPGPDILTVFNPLPVAMWLSLGGAVLVTSAVLYVSTMVTGKRGMESSYIEGEMSHTHVPWTVWDSVLIVFGSLVGQGAARHPVSLSGRLVLGCWWMFTILIVSIYTASLAALLTIRVQGKMVDSIEQLSQSSMTPIVLDGTSWHTAFKNDSHDLYFKISQRLRVVEDEMEAVELVKEGGVAYIQDVSAVDFLYRQDCRSLYMAEQVFSLNGLGLAVPEGAEYKDAINNVILKLQESGVLNVWRRHWWQATSVCSDHARHAAPSPNGMYSVTGKQQLEVISIGALLGLYGAVVVLSSIVFFGCIVWYTCRKRSRKRTITRTQS